jgi:D-beta-D-heptose 7-phosphate kinase / D-beta-D-heptose 1-phosphate adenosyltransferase
MATSQKSEISLSRLESLIARFRGRPVAVVGDWMLDRYIWGSASRLSPEAAVPVVDYTKESECLGGAGNVAANLAALGARVDAFGVTGDDEPGRSLRHRLPDWKLAGKGILADSCRPTTLKTRIIARNQQIARVDRESRDPIAEDLENKLASLVATSLAHVDAVVISDYDKGVVTDRLAERILSACAKKKIPALVKPKWSRLTVYRGAAAVVCNRKETEFLVTRALRDDASIEDAGRQLLAHFGCPAVVITRGGEGMSVFEQESRAMFHIAATNLDQPIGDHGATNSQQGRQVFDVTGAGDTVLATLALAVASGGSIREGAILGNAAAGVAVSKLGTSTVSPAELRAAVRELPPKARGGR